MHALMEIQGSKTYEKGDMGLTSKTKFVVHSRKSRSKWPSFVNSDLEWSGASTVRVSLVSGL